MPVILNLYNDEIELALKWYDTAMKKYKIPVHQDIIKRLKQNQEKLNNAKNNGEGCFITTAI